MKKLFKINWLTGGERGIRTLKSGSYRFVYTLKINSLARSLRTGSYRFISQWCKNGARLMIVVLPLMACTDTKSVCADGYVTYFIERVDVSSGEWVSSSVPCEINQ